MLVRAERRVDKALFYTMWASLIATVAAGIWLIVKTLGLNPEFETFLAVPIPLLIFMLTLALKVGRIQGELKTLGSKANTAHSIKIKTQLLDRILTNFVHHRIETKP